MITELDEKKHYFYWKPLHFIYRAKTVHMRLEEQFVSNEPEDFKIGGVIFKDTRKIESTKESKKYDIVFNNVVFFQAYDEFGHIESDDEEYDDGVVIVKYTKSTLNLCENSIGVV